MAAFVNVPWLSGHDQFLRAIVSGSEAGAQKARLRLAAQENQPRFASSFIGPGGIGGSPLEQARADAIRAQTAQETQDRSGLDTAQAEQSDLIRRGETPANAFFRSGLQRFGIKEPSADRMFEVNPGNQLVGIDPLTGQPKVMYSSPGKGANALTEDQARRLAARLRAQIANPMTNNPTDIADYEALAKRYPDWVTPYITPETPAPVPEEENKNAFPWELTWPFAGAIGAGALANRFIRGRNNSPTNAVSVGKYTVTPVE